MLFEKVLNYFPASVIIVCVCAVLVVCCFVCWKFGHSGTVCSTVALGTRWGLSSSPSTNHYKTRCVQPNQSLLRLEWNIHVVPFPWCKVPRCCVAHSKALSGRLIIWSCQKLQLFCFVASKLLSVLKHLRQLMTRKDMSPLSALLFPE